MVGILIFQDLCIVPLMLLIPALSGTGLTSLMSELKMGKAAVIIAVVLLSARWLVPALLHQVVRTKSRELFLTTIILLCLGIALLTSRFGLSLGSRRFSRGPHHIRVGVRPSGHIGYIAVQGQFHGSFFRIHRNAYGHRVCT